MGKPLPAHTVAAVVALKIFTDKSWFDISKDLQVNNETARQVYNRAKERAQSDDPLEILKCVYPKKSPGRPAAKRQSNGPVANGNGSVDNPPQPDSQGSLTTGTISRPKSNPKRRKELGNGKENLGTKQKRRKNDQVHKRIGGEQEHHGNIVTGRMERPADMEGGPQQPIQYIGTDRFAREHFLGGMGRTHLPGSHTPQARSDIGSLSGLPGFG